MHSPLPTAEMACASIQQEESQRDVLNTVTTPDVEMSAMYGKQKVYDKPLQCTACGIQGHSKEWCWTVVGYPKWHHKHKKPNGKAAQKPLENGQTPKSANAVQGSASAMDAESVQNITQQLESLVVACKCSSCCQGFRNR